MTAAEEDCAWVREQIAERGWTREIEELAELGLQLALSDRLQAPRHQNWVHEALKGERP